MNRPKTVILGGAGFLGSHLAEELVDNGYPVTLFARTAAERFLPRQLRDRVSFVGGDFLNAAEVSRALQSCELAVHAVSSTIPESSNLAPSFDAETNLIPTLRFLEEARRQGVKRVLLISSGGTVYGRATSFPIAEDAPTFPLCSYGILKLTLEKYLHMFTDLYGLRHTVVRLSNPYGERQNPTRRQGAVAVFLDRVARDLPIEVFGDGSVVRDYVYVKDATRGIRLVLESEQRDGVYNIGTGIGTTLNELVELIRKTTGRALDVKRLPSRPVDVPANVLRIDKVSSATGWKPASSLEDGIGRTWEWRRGLVTG